MSIVGAFADLDPAGKLIIGVGIPLGGALGVWGVSHMATEADRRRHWFRTEGQYRDRDDEVDWLASDRWRNRVTLAAGSLILAATIIPLIELANALGRGPAGFLVVSMFAAFGIAIFGGVGFFLADGFLDGYKAGRKSGSGILISILRGLLRTILVALGIAITGLFFLGWYQRGGM